MSSDPVATDIAIVGAGPVGLVAALALAADGWRVSVFGKAAAPRDGRTVALLDGSWQILTELGITPLLVDTAAPLAVMRLVDDTGSLFRQPPVEFRASEIGLDAFGWNVANVDLVEALLRQAQLSDRIALIDGMVSEVATGADAVALSGDDLAPHRARLVIGADGRQSRVRHTAGIVAREWSYPQTALTAILSHSRDHRDSSTEFHTRKGPCTLVPLPGRRSSLVWLLDPADAEQVAGLNDADFARRVETQTHSLLGALALAGPRGKIPMGGLSVERFAAQRMALVGEAAHVFPPLGAQGLNLGLRDIAALRGALRTAEDPGSDPVLDDYDRARQSDVCLRTGAVDMLNRSLLSSFLPSDLMRGAGLLALSRLGPLRRLVMRQGLAGGAAV